MVNLTSGLSGTQTRSGEGSTQPPENGFTRICRYLKRSHQVPYTAFTVYVIGGFEDINSKGNSYIGKGGNPVKKFYHRTLK